ncbi:MAG: hypothetical protein AAGF04_02395 [Chlamydiota bacterium]
MRRSFVFLLLFFSTFFVCLFFTPYFLQTPLGKWYLVDSLERSTGLHIDAHHFNLSWLGPQKFQHLHCQHRDFSFQVDDFSLETPLWRLWGSGADFSLFPQHLVMENAQLSWHPSEAPETLFEHLYAKIQAEDGMWHIDLDCYTRKKSTANVGKLVVHGLVSTLSWEIASTDWDRFFCDLQVRMQRVPSHLLDSLFAEQHCFLQAVCGAYISLEGDLFFTRGSGDVRCEIASRNLQTSLDGYWKERALFLNRALHVEYFPRERASESYLHKIHPQLGCVLSSNAPIKVRIDPEGFCYPAHGNCSIGHATCELGQLHCKQQGVLHSILSAVEDADLFASAQIDIWCTPLEFSIQDGVIRMERMDFLLDNRLHCFTWGEHNYLSDELSMTLAINPSIFEGVLQTVENKTPPLLLPLKGSIANPRAEKNGSNRSFLTLFFPEEELEIHSQTSAEKIHCKQIPPAPRVPWE